MDPINLTTNQLKLVVFGLWLKEKNGCHAFEILKTMPIKKCISKRTVQKWFKQFRNGQFEFGHKDRVGRPVTVTTEANAEKVVEEIAKERETTFKKLSAITGIKRGSLRNIIIRKLKIKKLRPLMNPHKLTPELKEERKQWCIEMLEKFKDPKEREKVITCDETFLFYEQERQGKVWTFPWEDYPRATKKTRYTTRKRMYILFFSSKGIVNVAYLPLNMTAKGPFYKLQLEVVQDTLRVDGANIVIHDNNAPIHKCNIVKQFYEETGVQRMTHPRYSPDLAPNDFWLIRKLKRSLDSFIANDDEHLYEKVISILNEIPVNEFQKCFDVWMKRMEKCIVADGDYFEWKKRYH